MLKGFNPWQRRVASLGAFGIAIILLGFAASSYPAIGGGFALTLLCLFVLILLGNRQNWRQLKELKDRVNKLPEASRSKREPGVSSPEAALPYTGFHHEYARRIQRSHKHYETFALMSKSVEIREAFALAATKYQFRYKELTRLIAVQRMEMLPGIRRSDFKNWDHKALLALARLEANQRSTESDLENAVRLFAFTENMFGLKSLTRTDQLIYLEALGELQRFEDQAGHARRFGLHLHLPLQQQLMEMNAVQSFEGADSATWLKKLNNIYLERGFTPVRFTEDNQVSALDRLRCDAPVITEGPLVSVIMPTFEGGPHLLTALNSLLQQSWQNLEIIVVDDASGPKYEQFLLKASDLSPKIKILRQPENLGAYSARNAGISGSTGEFITVHDDDDWSHGDKIATQVRHLLNNPDAPGNMSAHIRVTDDLKLLRINNNPILTQANFSSLMVHRSVFHEIGLWDAINRGADSEFRTRIKNYYGKPVEILDSVALSFTRTREGSLTSGELSRGYLDPARALYSKAYNQWHNSVGEERHLLRPGKTRNFPVPTTMEPGKRNQDLGNFDVVYMTDFKFPGGTTSLTLAEMQATSEAGYRVGFIQADSPLNRASAPITDRLFEMQLAGIVEQVGLSDKADISVLIVRHPSVVTFMDRTNTNLRVRKPLLIVNNPPVLVGGAGMSFDLPTCIQNMDNLFSSQTQVIAESGVTRKLCAYLVPEGRLLEMTWPGIIASFVGEQHQPDFSRAPVVGRHSRDHELKWPSTETEFHEVYTSTSFNTQFLGGVDTLINKLGDQVIQDKIVYDFGTVEVKDFLDSLDFWVYFHDERLHESFGMSIAEAMAAGKVVILPAYLETTFGDGAIYADTNEVEKIVLDFWSEPAKYRAQSELARAFVAENFSTDALLSRIDVLEKQGDTIQD